MTIDATSYSPQLRPSVKSLIITQEASKVCAFIQEVFGAQEIEAARTLDDDGLLIHSEFVVGDSIVVVLDTKEGWPFTPGLLWMFVDDVTSTLQAAQAFGAKVITEPTDFYGDTFSRIQDPWNNLWWVYQYGEHSDWGDEASGDESWSSEPDPETLKNLNYIHDSLMDVMAKLGT